VFKPLSVATFSPIYLNVEEAPWVGNREQSIAMILVMEALDEHEQNPQTAQQHFQYLGGEGGTGKSRVIQAITSLPLRRLQERAMLHWLLNLTTPARPFDYTGAF
jgi:hypothetical protein